MCAKENKREESRMVIATGSFLRRLVIAPARKIISSTTGAKMMAASANQLSGGTMAGAVSVDSRVSASLLSSSAMVS